MPGTSFHMTAMMNTMMLAPSPNRSMARSHIGNSGSAMHAYIGGIPRS